MNHEVIMNVPGYESLADVLYAAYLQAASGKGKDRHANDLPFDEQPMQSISQLLNSSTGMAFQAMKKIQESQRMDTGAAVRELYGAINYIAGAIIYLEEEQYKAEIAEAYHFDPEQYREELNDMDFTCDYGECVYADEDELEFPPVVGCASDLFDHKTNRNDLMDALRYMLPGSMQLMPEESANVQLGYDGTTEVPLAMTLHEELTRHAEDVMNLDELTNAERFASIKDMLVEYAENYPQFKFSVRFNFKDKLISVVVDEEGGE